MKKALAVAVAGLILSVTGSTPAQAHAISCAAYVGNEDCFQRAYLHNWWHRLLSNPLSVLR